MTDPNGSFSVAPLQQLLRVIIHLSHGANFSELVGLNGQDSARMDRTRQETALPIENA